ncbi:23520_t:CDS:1, partial [Entrophospora sp. SA101]
LDRWTSPTHDSIYNYVITTSRIVEKIGLHKFAAVVTDSGPNLRVTRRIINES